MGCSSSIISVSKTTFETNHVKSLTNCDDLEKIGNSVKNKVKATWEILSCDILGNGVKVLLTLFALDPELKHVFSLRDVDTTELLRNCLFKQHASRIMLAVGAVVDNMDDMESFVEPLLFSLGKQHYSIDGFKLDYLETFSQAILHVWKEELCENFNIDVCKAWCIILSYIVSKFQVGYNQAVTEQTLKLTTQ